MVKNSSAFLLLVCFLMLSSGCTITYEGPEIASKEEDGLMKDLRSMVDQLVHKRIDESEILDSNHPLFLRARNVLYNVLEGIVQQKINKEFDDLDESDGDWLRYDEPGYDNELRERYSSFIRLIVVVQDAPLAVVYPNGTLFVTTGLLDPEAPYSARNDSQLAGVFAHEFTHLYENDVKNFWLGSTAENRIQIKQLLSKISQMIPGFSFNYKATDFKVDPFTLRQFEIRADWNAVKILRYTIYDEKEYLFFLRLLKIYQEKNTKDSAVQTGWLDERAASLNQFLFPTEAMICFEKGNDKTKISAYGQYLLTQYAYRFMKEKDRAIFMNWMKNPYGRDICSVISTFKKEMQQDILYYAQAH